MRFYLSNFCHVDQWLVPGTAAAAAVSLATASDSIQQPKNKSLGLFYSVAVALWPNGHGLKNSEISKHVHIGLQKNLDFINVRLD